MTTNKQKEVIKYLRENNIRISAGGVAKDIIIHIPKYEKTEDYIKYAKILGKITETREKQICIIGTSWSIHDYIWYNRQEETQKGFIGKCKFCGLEFDKNDEWRLAKPNVCFECINKEVNE